ncbi:(3S,6E)-nerolidol synthase 1-like [Telopea speciosissima]|uniref:(3S,6E)-nerolidol synthase 1-like n=1 Tax=Telopea speciosissima TaxID=54955 RepID=UPI001CC7772A|nr:(3S,6E)-nerolidol synthase 1-like [Telopea speciosissima]
MGRQTCLVGRVLGAATVQGDTAVAELSPKQLIKLGPENDDLQVQLANIYTNAGRWDDVERLRGREYARGPQKSPGISLIQSRTESLPIRQDGDGVQAVYCQQNVKSMEGSGVFKTMAALFLAVYVSNKFNLKIFLFRGFYLEQMESKWNIGTNNLGIKAISRNLRLEIDRKRLTRWQGREVVGCSSCVVVKDYREEFEGLNIVQEYVKSYYVNALRIERYIDGLRIKHVKKCKEVKWTLNELQDPLERRIMIDTLQRLGINYHFEQDIKTALAKHYGSLSSGTFPFGDHNLHDIALYFRLLRQAGYLVPTDVFSSFMDEKGHFKVELREDIRGLMSLYEASHLGFKEEEILDEAHDYARMHLNASLMNLQPNLARAVKDTLENPYHMSLARFQSKCYLQNFHGTYGWMGLLEQLWKIDFNIVQSINRLELLQIFKWWREVGLSEELKFARNQPLKWYMWPMVVLPDPKFSEHRIEMTKIISLVYVIDDIFDVRGTLDELLPFTAAINKWEPTAIERLPNYMKICFKILDEITNEIADKVLREHGWNPLHSLRKAWGSLCDAFLVEAKWFASKQVPKANDYLENGVVSSGVHVVLLHGFFLLGEGITKENVDRVEHSPGPALMSCPATILRLWDDLGSAKDEEQDGHDGSYLECYLKDHKQGSSMESAREHVFDLISDSWKQLNRETLEWSSFSPSLMRVSLNSARMVKVMYGYDDNQRLPALEEYINSLLRESIPLY